MNDPRETAVFGSLMVEAFGVNDERALHDEVARGVHDLDWPGLSLDARHAMAAMVREALHRLADDVEEWLPAAAVARSDESFGFFVLWKNRHLDEEIVSQRVRADRDHEDRLAELQRFAGGQREPDGS